MHVYSTMGAFNPVGLNQINTFHSSFINMHKIVELLMRDICWFQNDVFNILRIK